MKILKVLAVFALFILFQNKTVAQNENNMKNFRFGLKATPMLTWYRTDSKAIEKDGVKAKFGYGLMMEFRLNKIISFATGIGGDYEGGKLNYKDSAVYFAYDNQIIEAADTVDKKYAKYLLNSRDFNTSYLNIPLTLKMKTNEIGGITYYGLFGGDLGIRLKAKANDDNTVLHVPSGFNYDARGINVTKDVSMFRICLNVGAGIEYNLSGSTSLVAGLNYRRGFLSGPKATSDYLLTVKNNVVGKFKQPAFGDAIALTVGILF